MRLLGLTEDSKQRPVDLVEDKHHLQPLALQVVLEVFGELSMLVDVDHGIVECAVDVLCLPACV